MYPTYVLTAWHATARELRHLLHGLLQQVLLRLPRLRLRLLLLRLLLLGLRLRTGRHALRVRLGDGILQCRT